MGEFMMHKIGDEQWCGVTATNRRAGAHGSLSGWFYYCGGRTDREGALHEGRERHKARGKHFAHVRDGDVIGMTLDLHRGGVAFSLNGELQGACLVPKAPLYVTTCLDKLEDHVELRKPALDVTPPGAAEAIAKALE